MFPRSLHLDRLLPEINDVDRLLERVDHPDHERLELRQLIIGHAAVKTEAGHVVIESSGLFGEALDGLRPSGGGFATELFVAVGQFVPVVAMRLDQLFELLAEALVERGVLVEVDGAVLADGVLHLAGFGLGVASGMPTD